MNDVRNRGLILAVTCLGFFMIMLDTTIVYVATPSLMTGLHATLDQVLWVFNGYLLTYAVLLITAGRLADVWGPRNLFAAGLALFTVASVLCGLAQDSNQLIAARVLQGVGGALLAPQSLTLLAAVFPPERRGAAFGINGAVVGISTVAGPTLGGLIVTYADWRWIFFLNVPVGVVAVAASLLAIPDLRPGVRHRLDLAGVALSTIALTLVVFGLIEGQRYDWSPGIWATLGAGAAVVAVFVAWEARQSEPLIPLRLFRERNFSLMSWTGAAMQFAMQGIFLPITIYTQSVLGMTPLRSGLTVAPMSVMAGIVAPFAGRLADRLGGKYLLMAGLTIFGGGAAWTALIARTDSVSLDFVLPMAVTGVGLGLVFAPMMAVAMLRITPREAASASAVLNSTRQLGSVLGAAVTGAVLQNQLAVALHDRAVTVSAQLPAPFRAGFVDGFSSAAKAGFSVGRGQDGGAQLPAGLPAQARQQVAQLVHDVFTNGYVAAMRPTVLVAVAVLAVAALSCLLVVGRPARAEARAEAAARPAA
jgi:EmrB/QacA subfamily drug resistance transporter